MNTLYYCEDCGEERPEIKAIRKYCEKHLNEHSPQEKEPWEKEFFDFVQKHEMYQRGFPVAETQDFIQSLLDAERAELVDMVDGLYPIYSEDDSQEERLVMLGKKKALDTVIEKIKNK
jgi:hypothetical protein